jgi:hypothetical protein
MPQSDTENKKYQLDQKRNGVQHEAHFLVFYRHGICFYSLAKWVIKFVAAAGT